MSRRYNTLPATIMFSPLKSRAVKQTVPCSAEEKWFRKRMTRYMDGIGPSRASSRKEENKSQALQDNSF
jgi:hypothetical protein